MTYCMQDVWPSNPVALTGPANRLFEDLPLDAKAAFQEAAAEEVCAAGCRAICLALSCGEGRLQAAD